MLPQLRSTVTCQDAVKDLGKDVKKDVLQFVILTYVKLGNNIS